MKKLLVILGLTYAAVTLLVANAALAAEPNVKPNILYILADDLGWKDVKFVARQGAAKPFFLYLTFNSPHTPY